MAAAAALASVSHFGSLSTLRAAFRLAIRPSSYALRTRALAHLSSAGPAAFSAPLPPQRYVRHISASSNEEAAAKAAVDTGGPTIFDKIIAKEIPSDIVYEDDKVLAFRDINPQAPVHILIIPKLRDGLTQLSKAEPRHTEILGHLLYASKIVAEKEGIAEGFRVVINNGPGGCQSVYHLHLHVLGGRQMKWPAG